MNIVSPAEERTTPIPTTSEGAVRSASLPAKEQHHENNCGEQDQSRCSRIKIPDILEILADEKDHGKVRGVEEDNDKIPYLRTTGFFPMLIDQ